MIESFLRFRWRRGIALFATALPLAALPLLVQVQLQAQQSTPQSLPALVPPQASYNFPVRQTLTYAVDWRVFPAGTAIIHLEQDGDRERITATADSVGAVNLLYKVSDKFQSNFNRRTGCSYQFSKQTVEGRRQVNTDLKLQYEQGKSTLDEKNLVKGSTKRQEAPIPSCVSDLLSGVFYAASQPIQVGKSFQIPIADAVRTVDVTMKAEGREEIKTPLATYQTIRVQPTASAGVVKNRGNIWIWYTDDERHIPVQMRARFFWGTITFHLTAIDQK